MQHRRRRISTLSLTAGVALLWSSGTMAQTATPASPPTPATTAQPGSISAEDARTPPRITAPWGDTGFRSLTSPGLETFEGDRDFQRYIARTDVARRRWDHRFGASTPPPRGPMTAMAFQDTPPECGPDDPACPDEAAASDIVVSAARTSSPVQSVATAVTTITNNQSANVDEGDIVKQIDHYLLVLQDGRIFAVDMAGQALRVASHINVYRNGNDDAWYDEMLVEGDRILITSYSYEDEATEIAVFRLDTATGRLSRDGAFLISSEDYYSSDNYATRIVGDRLVIYTPYEADDVTDPQGRPRIRRWLSEDERDALLEAGADEDRDGRLVGRSMLRADEIYRPVLPTVEPYVHSITICDLGDYSAERAPPCRVTAFTGPGSAEMFVTPDEVFLWVGMASEELGGDWYERKPCPAGRPDLATFAPAAVYRVPITATTPGVVGLGGRPFDQFSMDRSDGYFRGLWSISDPTCDLGDAPQPLAYTNIALREFTQAYTPLRAGRHVAVPSVPQGRVRNRFAGEWLVYGSGTDGRAAIPDAPEDDETPEKAALRLAERAASVVVVPVDRPSAAVSVPVGHNVIRIDRVGLDGMIVNGYRDHQGLTLTLLQLGATPHVAASAMLPGRFESEGRSHAFNSSVGLDGNGLLGVPTINELSMREWWRSETSDVSFLSVTGGAVRSLTDIGLLASTTMPLDERAPDYECEVSCTDWYGNSRPIFTGGRIFALMETELVEGRVVDGRMTELQRLDLAASFKAGD